MVPLVGAETMSTSGEPVPVPPAQSMKIGVAALCGTPTFMSLQVGAAACAAAGVSAIATGTSATAFHLRARLNTRRRSHMRGGGVKAGSRHEHHRGARDGRGLADRL